MAVFPVEVLPFFVCKKEEIGMKPHYQHTEELAEIYRQQGLNDEACAIYRKLSLRNPEKSVYFAELIDEIASEGKNR